MQLSIVVSPTRRERTVVVEEVLYTFGVVVLVRFSYGPRVPRRFGGFVQVFEALSTLNNASEDINNMRFLFFLRKVEKRPF